MEDQKPEASSGVRKTVTLTHQQLGVGGGVLAALALVSQLKGMFVPTEKGAAQDQQISQLQTSVLSLKDDFGHKLDRSNDKIIDRIDKLEERLTKGEDKLEARINLLESVQLNVKKQKTN